MLSNKTSKFRNWCMILYPDNEKHLEYKKYILANNKSVYILHDKDEVEGGQLNEFDDKGKKKAHFHIYFEFESPRSLKSVCTYLGLEECDLHLLQSCKSKWAYLKYILHFGYPEKFQYSIDDLKGDNDLIYKLNKKIMNDGMSEEKRVLELIQLINSQDGFISINEFAETVCYLGKWDIYRRSAIIFKSLIDEHNRIYLDTNEKEYNIMMF